MRTTPVLFSLFLGLATQFLPQEAWSQENCNGESLESAFRSGLVTQIGHKPVLRDLIYLPSCGKTVSELVVEARGNDPI